MPDIVYIFFLLLPAVILAIHQVEIIQKTVPNIGTMTDRFPHYKEVMELNGRGHIRFGIKASVNGNLMLSEKPANSIDINSYYSYIELIIGGWSNERCLIRVGTMQGDNGYVLTPNVLDGSVFRYIVYL